MNEIQRKGKESRKEEKKGEEINKEGGRVGGREEEVVKISKKKKVKEVVRDTKKRGK